MRPFFYLKPRTLRYTLIVIRTFRHKGLETFFLTGSREGIQPRHAARLERQLARLSDASTAGEMNLPGWSFHRLSGRLRGHFAVTVSGNWRLTFMFESGDAILVDYQDYH